MAEKYGKIHEVNVQDVKVTYLVNELIKCLPDESAFEHATRYFACPKHMEDLHWSLNPKILPDLRDSLVGSSQTQKNKYDQTKTQNLSVPDANTKQTRICVSTDTPVHAYTVHKPAISSTHTYNLCSHIPVTYMK